jgi:uncharacterized protein YkwD
MTRSSTAPARPLPTTARFLTVSLVAALLLLLAAGAASAQQSAGAAEEQMTQLINAERRAAGLAPLRSNVQLTGVGRSWTPRMAAAGSLSHNPNLGTEVAGAWTRLAENVGVARPSGSETPAAMVERLHRAFMASPGHRANVLGDFEQIGIGSTWRDGGLWVTVNFMKGGEVRDEAAVKEAVKVSQQVFGTGRQAQYAVIGRAEVFADALGGAGLAADRAPLLFTSGPTKDDPDPALHSSVAAELDRVLRQTGTVYLLGGPGAVSARVERELIATGYTVRRLAGPSRVETSVRVGEEIVRRHGAPKQILLARADDWPDAVTGGAYAAARRTPLVLTQTGALHPATQRFLADNAKAERIALGGAAALSDRVVAGAGARRISGADRTATAVAVAEELWGRKTGAAGDRFAMVPGYRSDGWAYALALAPWSAANDGPQLLVGDDVPASVRSYLERLGYHNGKKGDVMFATSLSTTLTDQLSRLVKG